jgi:glutamate synthase (NADPH/NADH) large chain
MADQKKGLYTPELESDACGTGLIANLNGIKSHQLVEDALTMLTNMEHRGACGCEANTGDGAGIMLQTPHEFFVKKCKELGFDLPDFGRYGVGVVFFPQNRTLRNQCRDLLSDYIDELGFDLLGYRMVPTDNESVGDSAVNVEPRMEHVFVKPKDTNWVKIELERKLFVLRKYSTHKIHQTYPETADHFYIASFSYKTVLYKGQLTTHQLRPYFHDLHDETLVSAIALIHSRFSTNTFPKWKLAQPFRYIAHNGEINTVTGNINWWKSKESLMRSTVFSDDELQKLYPVCGQALSDSANFDNVLEFLIMNGRSLPHALMMMIPEAWQHDAQMADYKKSFYEYHETMMEPWDGPAAVCFSDGIVVGAMLDRNGLRPLRYQITDDNVLIAASEAGALPIDPAKIVFKGRLQPGKMSVSYTHLTLPTKP